MNGLGDALSLRDATAGAETVSMAAVSSSDGEGYTCPITGETLPCEKCCPLNKK